MESLQHLSEGLDSFWRLRQLELVANYVVEARVPSIILFCVIHKDGDNSYKWQTFRPKGFHQTQILHVDEKSGSDEGLWAEMSVIHITYRHFCGLHKKENNHGNGRLNYIIRLPDYSEQTMIILINV